MRRNSYKCIKNCKAHTACLLIYSPDYNNEVVHEYRIVNGPGNKLAFVEARGRVSYVVAQVDTPQQKDHLT